MWTLWSIPLVSLSKRFECTMIVEFSETYAPVNWDSMFTLQQNLYTPPQQWCVFCQTWKSTVELGSTSSNSPPHPGKVQIPHPQARKIVKCLGGGGVEGVRASIWLVHCSLSVVLFSVYGCPYVQKSNRRRTDNGGIALNLNTCETLVRFQKIFHSLFLVFCNWPSICF